MSRRVATVAHQVRRRKCQPAIAPQATRVVAPLGYGWPFWQAYASNVLLGAAIAVLFRYADFVTVLGGTEWHLGWIVGVGMIGSLAVQLAMGSCIDHYGVRIVWIGSLLLFVGTCFAHLLVQSCTGPTIYALRILYSCSCAAVYGASLTLVAKRAPQNRMAELYGMLGTATFVGYLGGGPLSDLLFSFGQLDRASAVLLFEVAGALAVLAIPLTWAACRGDAPQHAGARQSVWRVLRRHHPMTTFLVGAVMGMIVGMPNTFLRAYVGQLGFSRIGLFYAVCAVVAVGVRFPTRRWPERYGNRAIILLGAAGMAASQLAFLLVRCEWELVLPAAIFGVSQAVMFPAVTAAGSAAFPASNRGLATTLILGASDVGLLIGSPLTGLILSYSEALGLPAYPTLFVFMAVMMAAAAGVFAVANRETREPTTEPANESPSGA